MAVYKIIYRYIYVEHSLNLKPSTGNTKTIHLFALDNVNYKIKTLPSTYKSHMDLYLSIDNIEDGCNYYFHPYTNPDSDQYEYINLYWK